MTRSGIISPISPFQMRVLIAPASAALHEGKYRANATLPLGNMDHTDTDTDIEALVAGAAEAATFLKALGHDGRLLILCHLQSGPKSVTELENLLSTRQAAVSQQLARLRLEGLVSARREGQAIFYSILDERVSEVIGVLAKLFCKPAQDRARTST